MIYFLLLILILLLLIFFVCKKELFSSPNKNIIQTWKDHNIPNKYKNYVKRIKKLNPNWNYMFFTDNDIINFIKSKFPQYLNTYNNFKYKIQKIDFFRYLAIYYYGGLYLDLDMNINKPFNNLNLKKCIFPIEFSQNTDKLLIKQNMNNLIGQYAFYAPKNNSFIRYIIDSIVNPLIKKEDVPIYDNKAINKQKEIFYTTGPVLVTQSYINFKNKNLIQLLSSSNKGPSFGNYAEHMMTGTWK